MTRNPIYPAGSVVMAPLSGHTDLPFRRSCRRHGCEMAFTEMVDCSSLTHAFDKTQGFLERGPEEDWLAVQLVGADPVELAKAVEILNSREFSLIDLNLGCPMPKVTRKGKGAALGANPDKAARALESIVKTSRFPVTAKIRILDESDPAPTIELARKLADAGARAISIHGRIWEKIYAGPCMAGIIKAVAESVNVQVLANGGAVDSVSADALRKASGCDTVMVARGAMGNPWIFKELADPAAFTPPTVIELCAEINTHVKEIISRDGEEQGMRIARKYILDYLQGRGFGGKVKLRASMLSRLSELDEFLTDLEFFSPTISRGVRTLAASDTSH